MAESVAPQRIVYERWWTVYDNGTNGKSYDYPLAEDAVRAAVNLLQSGSYGVSIYKTDRPADAA